MANVFHTIVPMRRAGVIAALSIALWRAGSPPSLRGLPSREGHQVGRIGQFLALLTNNKALGQQNAAMQKISLGCHIFLLPKV